MGTNTLTHRPAGTGGPPASRRGYLDVLRCLAIFLVIALHCTAGQIVRPELFGTRTWLACDIVNGFARMGVPLFFMISGFLLLSCSGTSSITSRPAPPADRPPGSSPSSRSSPARGASITSGSSIRSPGSIC